MLLAVDIGNTRAKAAVFENDTALSQFVFDESTAEEKLSAVAKNFVIDAIIVSSVGGWSPNLKNHFPDAEVHFLSVASLLPFKIKYATPQTLGIDRIALSAGAVLHSPHRNRLVIDAGTCITYDFISDSDYYLGGAISPGINLRYKSLHDYTAKLPLLELDDPESLTGNSTNQSIHSGVVIGTVAEIDGIISQYAEKHSNFITILTGGDSEILAKRLKNTIFANSNFLLESLNKLHQYQIAHD